MANYNKDRGRPYYWHKQSVPTPTFIDLDKYLPKSEDTGVSPFNRQYPKPITSTLINQKYSNNTPYKGRKNKNFKTTTASRTTSSDGDTLKVNATREQRTVSLSSGEALYIKSGQDTGRRPAKRRHHSTATPGFQDEIEAKRTKINYGAPQVPHPARSLQFNSFDTEQPVFTLQTVSILSNCFTNLHIRSHCLSFICMYPSLSFVGCTDAKKELSRLFNKRWPVCLQN